MSTIEKSINIDTLSKDTFLNLEANKDELLELSNNLKDLNVIRVLELKCNLVVKKVNNYKILIKGLIKAKIVQECGVTLEEVESGVEADVEKIYLIKNDDVEDIKKIKKNYVASTNELDEDSDEEVVKGNIINIKDVIHEELVLNIDIYKTKENIDFSDYYEEKKSNNPFKNLKNND